MPGKDKGEGNLNRWEECWLQKSLFKIRGNRDRAIEAWRMGWLENNSKVAQSPSQLTHCQESEGTTGGGKVQEGSCGRPVHREAARSASC